MKTPNPETDRKEGEPNKGPKSSKFWLEQIGQAKKDHKDFWDYGVNCEARYKNERKTAGKGRTKRHAIFYSNTETVRSALFARPAKPDVRQRYTQKQDKLAKTVAQMIERALSYCGDTTEHANQYKKGVLDYSLAGRGLVRVVYEPVIKTEVDEITGQEAEYIADQKIKDEFVYFRDFLHSDARCWSEVWWIAFRHRMTRSDMEDAGFPEADDIPLNWVPDGQDEDKCPEGLKRAEVWEIWDKSKRQRVYVVDGHPTVCKEDDDPYGLENFWPMAEPIQAIVSNDTFIPGALLSEYEDQADDLNEITDRISRLTKALKRRGVYDANVKELKRLATAQDNVYIGVQNYSQFVQAGGMQGAFQTEDLKPIAETLISLYQQRDQLIQAIYETSGISDVMRGSTDPNETLGAQSLKAQFGSARMRLAQGDVAAWSRDNLRVRAELIAEHSEPHVLMSMAGMELPSRAEVEQQHMQAQIQAQSQGMQPPPPPDVITIDDVMQVLRDDKLRSYLIDIETDSTIFEDAEEEKQSRTELLAAIGEFMTVWMPIVQAGGPPMLKLAFEMLQFAVRGFKAGRQLEDAIEECRTALEQASQQQAQQPPPPDPKAEAEAAKAETVKVKAAADQQLTGMKIEQAERQHQYRMEEMDMQRMMPQPGATQ